MLNKKNKLLIPFLYKNIKNLRHKNKPSFDVKEGFCFSLSKLLSDGLRFSVGVEGFDQSPHSQGTSLTFSKYFNMFLILFISHALHRTAVELLQVFPVMGNVVGKIQGRKYLTQRYFLLCGRRLRPGSTP